MKRRLGYLYLHAPDPENSGQHVTYRIVVEEETLNDSEDAEDGGEAANEDD
jgi:hypothetical protein